jgi:putative salt-induced outer membrane protein YdiY
MKTEYAEKVVIKWDAVKTFKSDKPIAVTLKDKQELTGLADTAADGSMTLKSNGVYNTQPIPLTNITEINKKFFSGSANVGGSLSDGNTNRQAYHGDANVALRGRDDKVALGGMYNYADNETTNVTTGATENTLNARNWQLFGTYSHFFSDKWYGYAHGLFTNDRLQDIQLRSAFGVGAGYEFFSSVDLNLSFEAGPDYVSTNFYNTAFACGSLIKPCTPLNDTSGIAARWFVNYDQFILKGISINRNSDTQKINLS